ncbi:MAG: hypothetical protein ACMUJJ_07515 [Roseicyclus sp.]|uniref:hypothetical protein n=1 Tax=Roseicyclus sp. TaxID=1914329 RepID=UPI003A8A45D1
MRRLLLSCLALLLPAFLAAPPARAEVAIGDHPALTTRHGVIEVRGGFAQERLYWNGQIVPGLTDGFLAILGAWGRAEESFDWVILTHFPGGNACDPPFIVLQVSAMGLRRSPPIGGCIWPLLDLRVEPGRIALDLPHRDLNVARETFTWDGQTLTSSLTFQPAAQVPAGPGPDVTRWIGTHPSRIFEDAGERARFAAILSPDQIQTLSTAVSVANTVTRSGDWVIGQGCFPHRCNLERGLWALRISDGAPAAAFLSRDGGARLFGPAATDPTLRAAIAAHRP